MINEHVKKLLRAFPNSYINHNCEFIASNTGNQYFSLDRIHSLSVLQQRVISSLSRGACKAEPRSTKKKNNEFHTFMLNGINTFLETEFTHEDMERIYTQFGNGLNSLYCFGFVNDNFNMNIIDNLERRKYD